MLPYYAHCLMPLCCMQCLILYHYIHVSVTHSPLHISVTLCNSLTLQCPILLYYTQCLMPLFYSVSVFIKMTHKSFIYSVSWLSFLHNTSYLSHNWAALLKELGIFTKNVWIFILIIRIWEKLSTCLGVESKQEFEDFKWIFICTVFGEDSQLL